MKNFYLAILAIAISTSAVQAQNFTKGDFSVNLGTGYGPILTPKGVTAERQVPHLSLSLDYGLMQFGKATIGLGVYGGFSQERLTSVTIPGGKYTHKVDPKQLPEGHPAVELPYSYSAATHKFPTHTNYKYATIGGKIAINYQVIENLDLYAGTMLGYCFATPGAKNKDLGTIAISATTDLPADNRGYEMAVGSAPQISAGIGLKAQEDVKKEITKKAGKFAPIFFAGARYYVTNNVAIFAEGGYGLTYAQAGLSFKF